MAKYLRRLGSDKVKFIVNFSAQDVTVTSQENIYLKLQVARGDQSPENLKPILVQGTGRQTVNFSRNKTPFECSVYIKDGVPEPKIATLSLFITDAAGKGAFLAATVDINFTNHFGD